MGHPEKDDYKDIPPSAADLIENIDNYQKRVEQEWDSAKASYQKKINQIMEEFLDQGFTVETPSLPNENHSSQIKDELQKSPPKKSHLNDAHMASLLARVEKELRDSERKTKQLTFFEKRPMTLSISWQPTTFRISKPGPKTNVFLLCLASLGIAAFLFFQSPKLTPLPYAHTLGPVVIDGKIYIADWFRKSLYIHSTKSGLPILSVENLPNNLMTGLAVDPKTVWTLDGMDKKLIKHSATVDHQVQSSFDSPGSHPVGLYFDGADLWSADLDTKKIYHHRGNDVEDIREEYPFTEGNLTGLSVQNNRIWILDGKSRELSIYRLQDPLRMMGSFDLDPFLRGATPTGFSLAEKTIWMVTENPAGLVKIPIRKLKTSQKAAF